jgi:N-acetylated-alpha-linked acidic dipeptidase
VAPERWRGALPITYHVGGGPARVHIAVSFDWKTRPLYDVIATIKGATDPDQWVIYGNHHDAWVNGANDPIAGQVALDETARSLGALLKTGWRPARTIILAAWDGEEWGLLGSTEWAEGHAAELADKAVTYYNSDTNDRGWFGASGSHSLQVFFQQVARDITDPVTGKSALDAAQGHDRASRRGSRDSTADTAFAIDALGSGSDYSTFIDHLGIASADVRYGGQTHDGIYHSIYDSWTFYGRFLDTSYAYGVAEAQTMGTALVRMADAPVLPFEFRAAAKTYRRYTDEVEKLAQKNDTTKGLDLSAVRAALGRLDSAAAHYEATLGTLETTPAETLRKRHAVLAPVNHQIAQTERALTDTAGLPNRPWYQHLIYAPGFYTGYGVKTLPGIREAVEQRRPVEAQAQAARVAAALDRLAAAVERASTALATALR